MRRKAFRRAFTKSSRESVLLLQSLPLSDVNRYAMESAARKTSVEALLAANFPLMRTCHEIAVLASSASGPAIPEGRARLRALRTALRRAERESGLYGSPVPPSGERDTFGCPYAQLPFERGPFPVPSVVLERSKSLGTGLRLLRFRPGDLKKKPKDLAEGLSDLALRGGILGLYAVMGRWSSPGAREFALFTSDYPGEKGPGFAAYDPLRRLPVTGLIRTLLEAGADSKPNLAGLRLVDVPFSRKPPDGAGRQERQSNTENPENPEKSPGSGAGSHASPRGCFKFHTHSSAFEAARSGAALEGEYRNATVLYAEIQDLPSLSRGLESARAAERLNRLLTRLSRCVEASDGVVDAFIGGSMYAFWGAPSASGRDAEYAAAAALAMRESLLSLTLNRAASGKPSVRMGCGIDSSPVLAALLGSPRRVSYTVGGMATGRASVIGYWNEVLGTDILVSDYTLHLMGNSFLTHPVEGIRTKSEILPIHALIGRRDDPSGPRDLKDLRELLRTSSSR